MLSNEAASARSRDRLVRACTTSMLSLPRKLRQALLGLRTPHQHDHSLNRLSPVEMTLELTHKPRL